MLKGVNKCIVEVSATGSKYFEKALIFVRPEYAALSPGRLQSDAKDFLQELEKTQDATVPGYVRLSRRQNRPQKRKLRRWVMALLCGVGIVLYSFLIRMI